MAVLGVLFTKFNTDKEGIGTLRSLGCSGGGDQAAAPGSSPTGWMALGTLGILGWIGWNIKTRGYVGGDIAPRGYLTNCLTLFYLLFSGRSSRTVTAVRQSSLSRS